MAIKKISTRAFFTKSFLCCLHFFYSGFFLGCLLYWACVDRRDSFDISTPKETYSNCYSYQNEEDVKNIAFFIIEKKFGINALNAQKRFIAIYEKPTEYYSGAFYVWGNPEGPFRWIRYFFGSNFVDPIVVEMPEDKEHKCLFVKSVAYTKEYI